MGTLIRHRIEVTKKSLGAVTKTFFPNINCTTKPKINFKVNFRSMVTRHAPIQSYLHRFKISDSPRYPCNDRPTLFNLLLQVTKHTKRETEESGSQKRIMTSKSKCIDIHTNSMAYGTRGWMLHSQGLSNNPYSEWIIKFTVSMNLKNFNII